MIGWSNRVYFYYITLNKNLVSHIPNVHLILGFFIYDSFVDTEKKNATYLQIMKKNLKWRLVFPQM